MGLFAGRPGVGMLLGTVALLVNGVSVGIILTGGRGVEYNGSARTVAIEGRALFSWGERETCLERFILFIS